MGIVPYSKTAHKFALRDREGRSREYFLMVVLDAFSQPEVDFLLERDLRNGQSDPSTPDPLPAETLLISLYGMMESPSLSFS